MNLTRWIPAVLVCLILSYATPSAAQDIVALTAYDTVLDGRADLVGVTVGEDGARYVSDRLAGAVYRISTSGSVTTVATNLSHPAGLAFDGSHRLLIAEEMTGRIVRLEGTGQLTTIASGMKTPRWIAVDPSGSLYVSAHRLTSPDGTDPTEGRVIIRIAPDGGMAEVATGIRSIEGLLRLNGAVLAASKGLLSESASSGVILRYPVNSDGSLGTPLAWVGTGLKQPKGVATDILGAIYVSSKELLIEDDRLKRAIAKIHPNQILTDFAANLFDPQGIALGPDGSLYVADGVSGRLYRFHAPSPPLLDPLPEFTNQASLPIAGTTVAAARVTLIAENGDASSATADSTGPLCLERAARPECAE